MTGKTSEHSSSRSAAAEPAPTPADLVQEALDAAMAAGVQVGPGSKPRLPKRRPAEFSAFVTAVASLGAYFGIDQASGILYAGLGVAATLPFAVSAMVDLYRQAFKGMRL